MCGIAGFFNYKTQHPAKEEHVCAILESIKYRGPDHLGIFTDKDLSIGNVRLAILGITEAGNQPVYNEDRSVVVVFNGELYNFPELKKDLENKGHIFSTTTDTEALVHLYEEYHEDMATELNGMFTFALFDRTNRKLLIARDRTAQKPLYIHRTRHGIFFSSELKSMLPYLESCTLNPEAVRTFLSIGYALEPETIIKEIETFEPGSLSIFDYEGERTRTYWQPRIDHTAIITNPEEWQERADQVIKTAVHRHLLSDVPVTVMLSGGIDSSVISLYLREENKIQKAFTGSFVDQESHDEYGYAAKLGKYCGFEVEPVGLTNRLLADNLEEVLSRASMPLGDYSGLATYTLAKHIARQFRVVLGGDGGDELFGGYPTYTLPHLARRFSIMPKSAIDLARRLTSFVSDREKYLSLPFKLQQLSLAWGRNTAEAHFSMKDFLPGPLASVLLDSGFFKGETGAGYGISRFENYYDTAPFDDPVHRLCWIDFNTFLRSQTIPKVDRNTMLSSLEARIPYLDNEVLDLSLHTDASLMVRGTNTKVCLKKLLKKKVSNHVGMNPIKQGFSPPLVALLDRELKEWKEHWLSFRAPYLTVDSTKRLKEWRNKGWDFHRLEWNICVLNDWCSRSNLL